MRIDKLRIDRFKNLDRFEIDFDESQLTTVLVGENATGKSNLFEAIIRIFRHLDLDEAPPFGYRIDYQCRGHQVQIEAEKAKTFASGTSVTVDGGKKLSAKAFRERKDDLLPKNVFAYYSGPSRRLQGHFDTHLKKFYDAQREGKSVEGLRRLFYARLVHSNFVLLSFFSSPDESHRDFLRDHLGITGLESVLFVFRDPGWPSGKGDPRFFGAEGIVSEFLARLWNQALAPLRETVGVRDDIRRKPVRKEELYLYLPTAERLQALAEGYEPSELFKDLESTYISDIIREVRVLVRRKSAEGPLGFGELSEGEQQLLTVLGLLRFTKDEESLFLLDEPDTHLNPVWKLRYLQLIEDAVKPDENSQLVIATHSPLTIASLLKSQVQIFTRDSDGRPVVDPPDVDPRGLGVAGVLTEMFGLPTTLDPKTQDDIDRRNRLAAITPEERAPEQKSELRRLSAELAREGFALQFRDPILTRFYTEAIKRPEFQKPPSTAGATAEQVAVANEILDEILAEESSDVLE